MNKHIINALNNYTFIYKGNCGYGHINGYEVNVSNNPLDMGPIFMFSTFLSPSKKDEFISKMDAKKISMVYSQSFEFGVSVMIGAMTAKSFEQKCAEVMPIILEVLESLEAPKSEICPKSGEKIDELYCRTVILPGSKIKIRLSNNAITAINNDIKNTNNGPNNYLKGFLGILIGVLVGSALMVGLYLLSFLTALATLASIYFGIFLYKKFGGKQGYAMIVMSLITTLLFVFSTIVVVYTVAANNAVAENNLPYKGFEALVYYIDNSVNFKRRFYSDILLNGGFIILEETFLFIQLFVASKKQKFL